jgi:toxin CcdB
MAQFDVYENLNSLNNEKIPYFIDVQHNILNHIDSRVVIPLSFEEKEINTLSPKIIIDNIELILLTTQISAISPTFMGKKVCSLENKRNEILNAIDFLITGY